MNKNKNLNIITFSAILILFSNLIFIGYEVETVSKTALVFTLLYFIVNFKFKVFIKVILMVFLLFFVCY